MTRPLPQLLLTLQWLPLLCLGYTCDPTSCKQCENANQCAPGQCAPGWGPSGVAGQCIQCGHNCSTCNQNACLTCQPGSGKNNQDVKVCLSCLIDGCSQCSYNYTNCELCQDGKGLDTNKQCQNCPQNCKKCDVFVTQCQQCQSSYGLTQAKLCQPCGTNCLECKNKHLLCETCNDTFFPTGGPDCLECLGQKCLECPNLYNICLKCQDGWGPAYDVNYENRICSQCPEECQRCSRSKLYCDQCSSGYGKNIDVLFGYTGKCKKCGQNCLKCQFSSVIRCLQCKPGYGTDSNRGQTACSICVVGHCQLCSSYYSCQKCQQPYKLHQTTKICGMCEENCINCTDPSTCNICAEGYGIANQTPLCKKCEENCIKCSQDHQKCEECANTTKHGLHQYKCVSCIGCLTCEPTSASHCTSCERGKFLKDQVGENNGNPFCKECHEKCQHCTAEFECLECVKGYKVHDDDPSPNKVCEQICGDGHTQNFDCDLEIQYEYTGCTEQCQQETNFTCEVYSNGSTQCSYVERLETKLVEVVRHDFENLVDISIEVWPPLAVFRKLSPNQLSKIFFVTTEGLSQMTASFDPKSSTIKLTCGFSSVLPQNFEIEFHQTLVPQQNSVFALPSSINRFPFTKFSKTILPFVDFICIFITILSAMCIVIGLYTKRIAGIQALFVVQIVWIMFLWNSKNPILLFKKLHYLKFINGINLSFFQETNINNDIQIGYFGLGTLFANNFNLWALPMFFLTVGFCIASSHYKFTKKSNTQTKELNSSTPIKDTLVQFLSAYLCITVLGNVNNILIFISYSNNVTHILSVCLMALYFAIVFLVCFVFFRLPFYFGYFKESFHAHQYVNFLILEAICAITVVILIALSHSLPFLQFLPPFMIIVYVLWVKPYNDSFDNRRVILNHLLLCGCLGFNILSVYFPSFLERDSVIVNVAFVVILFLVVPSLLLFASVSMLYLHFYSQFILPIDEVVCELPEFRQKQRNIKILQELQLSRVSTKIKNTKNSTFSFILPLSFSIKQASNTLVDTYGFDPKESKAVQSEALISMLQNLQTQQTTRRALFDEDTQGHNIYPQSQKTKKRERIQKQFLKDFGDTLINITEIDKKEKDFSSHTSQDFGFFEKDAKTNSTFESGLEKDQQIARKILYEQNRQINMNGAKQYMQKYQYNNPDFQFVQVYDTI